MLDVPLNSQDTAKMAGRQAIGPLIEAIRATIAGIVQTTENESIIHPLLNIVIALDEHRQYRGDQAVKKWLFGANGPHDLDELIAILDKLDELENEVQQNRGHIYKAFVNLCDKLRSDDGGPDNG